MNTIYKLVWNHRTRSLVAASELAKGRKKNTVTRGLVTALVLGLASGAASADAKSTDDICIDENGQQISCTVEQNGKQTASTSMSTQSAIAPLEGSLTPGQAGIAIDIGNTAATATARFNSDIAIGVGATAAGDGNGAPSATALGFGAQAIGGGSIAIGNEAHAGDHATAVGANTNASGNYSLAVGANAVASAVGSIAVGASASATADFSAAIGANSIADRENTLSVGSAATDGTGFTRQITNVANGLQANDAVNVSQLTSIVNALGGGANIDPTTGEVTGPTYTIGGEAVEGGVGGAIGAMDSAITQNTTNITNLTDQINNGTVGMVQQAAAGANLTVGANTDGTAIDFTGTAGTRTLTGLADGNVAAGSTDAINGSQLQAVNDSIAAFDGRLGDAEGAIGDINTRIGNLEAGVATGISYDDATRASVTLAGIGGTLLTNVANGNIAVGSTDAVNGGQVAAIQDALQGQFDSLNDRVGSIEGSQLTPPEKSVGNDAGGAPITNVGNGVADTDGANLGQVKAAQQQAINAANAYTDSRVAELNQSLDQFKGDVASRFAQQDRRINSVGAMSAAMSMMAFSTQGVDTPNRVGVGLGFQGGRAALAAGYSRSVMQNVKVAIGGSVSGNEANGGVGAGFGW
jgi:trimeric autotransporter adhesin